MKGMVSADPFAISSGELSASGRVRTANQEIDAEITGRLGDVGLLAQGASGAVDFARDGEGRAGDARCFADGDQRPDRGGGARNRRAEARRDRQGRCRQSGRRCLAVRHGRRRGAGRQGDRFDVSAAGARSRGCRCRWAKTASPATSCSTRISCRSARSTSQLPDVGAAGGAGAGDGQGRPQRHDQLHRQWRQARSSRSTHARPRSRAATCRRKTSSIDATVADYLVGSGHFRQGPAATVTSGKTVVRDIDVTLTRDGVWTGFDGGATVSDIPARAAGRVQDRRRQDGHRTRLGAGDGARPARPGWRARLDGRDRRRHDDARQGRARCRRRHGRGVGNGRLALNLNATLSAVPASVANSFAPGLDAAGTISGTAKVTGAAANPAVGYSIDWRGAQTAQTRSAGFGAMSITSSGDFAGGRLTFQRQCRRRVRPGHQGGGTVDTRSRALVARFLRRRAVLLPDASGWPRRACR